MSWDATGVVGYVGAETYPTARSKYMDPVSAILVLVKSTVLNSNLLKLLNLTKTTTIIGIQNVWECDSKTLLANY